MSLYLKQTVIYSLKNKLSTLTVHNLYGIDFLNFLQRLLCVFCIVLHCRRSSQKTCRLFKNLIHEARERASKALGFAKLLRKVCICFLDF